MTVEESLEKGENDFEGIWSGVPSSFTSIGLYSNAVQLHLPISLVAEEFMVGKCRRVMTLHDLLEQWLGNTGVQTRSGRKWFTMWEGDQAESLLVFRDIILVSHFQLWAMADKSENRSMVQGKVKREIEEIRRSRAAEVSKQRVWIWRDNATVCGRSYGRTNTGLCFFYDQTGVWY